MRSHAWSVASAFVIPVVYQATITYAYGDLDNAMNTLYRVKESNLPTLLAVGFPANLSMGVVCMRYILKTLEQGADEAEKEAMKKKQ